MVLGSGLFLDWGLMFFQLSRKMKTGSIKILAGRLFSLISYNPRDIRGNMVARGILEGEMLESAG